LKEYRHVVIDKAGVGLPALRQSIAASGLETAYARGIQLSGGSMKLEHHLNVFLWDDSIAGQKGYLGIVLAGNCITVRVRWDHLLESGLVFPGTLKGDGGHAGIPAGKSPNGAWAFKGSIPRNYCFIDDLDTQATPDYEKWKTGTGWV
jgi:hypothetical protein